MYSLRQTQFETLIGKVHQNTYCYAQSGSITYIFNFLQTLNTSKNLTLEGKDG
jgi:hypothetical protein